MKKGLYIILFIFLLILPICFSAEDYYNADEITVNLEIKNTLIIVPKKTDYSLNNVKVFLSFYPRTDFQQKVNSMDTSPDYELVDDDYKFQWNHPKITQIPYTVSSQVTTKSSLIEVREKIKFPLTGLSSDVTEFIKETPTIDYNTGEIKNKAKELSAGEDDLYVVVFNLATWVNKNIKYDLNTKTADASQSASWVMSEKIGVCDELTNLFIGMCRSLGIPARFVSGISYSNLDLFVDNWSPHGWAEVYFPDYGWVPFDVTYGEFGYIDPTHIKLKVATDANRSSTKYEWEGYNVGIKTNKLTINTKVLNAIGRVQPKVNIKATPIKNNLGFNSYDAVMVEIINPNDYYVPTELTLSRSEGIEVLDEQSRHILLKPKETRLEFWHFRLDSDQEDNYIYNFTIKAYTIRNASDTINIMSTQSYVTYSSLEIDKIISLIIEESEKPYSKNIDLSCELLRDEYYSNEEVEINCDIKNNGNIDMDNLAICFDTICKSVLVQKQNSKQVKLSKIFSESSNQDALVTLKNDQITKFTSVNFEIWNKPAINIMELSYPENVKMDDKFKIEFKIEPKTESLPQNVKIILKGDSFEKIWEVYELDQNRRYILNVDENTLAKVNNQFDLQFFYSDKLGKEYSTKQTFTITVKNPTIKDKALMYLNRFNLNLRYNLIFITIAIFVAGIVVGLIFKTTRKE